MRWCGGIPALLEGDFYCSTSQLQPLRQGQPPSHVTRRSRVSPNTSHVSRLTSHFTRHTSLASHASHVTFSADNSVLFFHCFDCVAADTPPGPTDDEPSRRGGGVRGNSSAGVYMECIHFTHVTHVCTCDSRSGGGGSRRRRGVRAALSQPTPSLVTDGDA